MTRNLEVRNKTQVARYHRKAKLATRPPRPRLRKRLRPVRRKTTVINAIPGTYGSITKLAQILHCTTGTLVHQLNQPGWELVKEAIQEEALRAKEQSLVNIYDIASNAANPVVRLKANCWIVEKTIPGYAPTTKMKVEGDPDYPIRHEHLHVVAHRDVLDCPIEERKRVLAEMEAREVEEAVDES